MTKAINTVKTTDSILTSIKKLIGFSEDYEQFDVDVIININSSLSDLWSLGAGPNDGFVISDKSSTWKEFVGENKILFGRVVLFIYLKAKLVFDPPSSSAVIQSYKEEIAKQEWLIEAMPGNKSGNE